jgi:hypothetical protein
MGLNFLLDRGDLIKNVSTEFISEIFLKSHRPVAVVFQSSGSAAYHNKLAFSLIVCQVRHTTRYAQLGPLRRPVGRLKAKA